ncbi:hypothetical protein PORY_001236 [Pneumocystis oryctolagi]|uniref:Uncharacterized protein n=1 Tax=Pneumocystis oryctolagi TaxID=42067 RepID=A0ACB7CBY8_9ASCO|nr:hypothetical protein PORY_001236 [Pneumocystis oryctolagi]
MRSKTRLSQSLDDKIRFYLKECPEEFLKVPFDIPGIYEYLQSRDLILRRIKKYVLEMSIERVLKTQNTYSTPDDCEEEFQHVRFAENIAEMPMSTEFSGGNVMNKEITSVWKCETNDSSSKISQKSTSDSLKNEVLKDESHSVFRTKRKYKVDKEEPSYKKEKLNKNYEPPKGISFDDLGGIDDCIDEILEHIVMPLTHPEIYVHFGIQLPRGVLLHGPSGCGKTLLANAIASEIGLPFISISAPSIISGMSGESEKKIRDIFNDAKSIAPCLIFIDEIDAVTPKRENAQREMERRIVAQFLTCMDDLSLEKTDGKPVLIIGATNRPDSLDPALRRAGRFDREICLNVPNELGREKILRTILKKLRLSGDFDYKKLAKMTPGYVGADLNSLATASGVVAIKRIFKLLQNNALVDEKTNFQSNGNLSQCMNEKDQDNVTFMDLDASCVPDNSKNTSIIRHFLKTYPNTLSYNDLSLMYITIDDFLEALPKIQPSSKREGFATVPDVTWADVGALKSIRIEMQMAIVQPIKRPELYEKLGITSPSGVLLWGPPGCGKTLLAKAVANESCANFISVRGPELLNKYLGESERAVRQVFSRARASVPCIIFFDELDAIVPRRDDSLPESSARVVNTLLTELDGLNDRRGIYVIAATNRPDIIDPAMMRPGRLDKPLFVELPSNIERYEILKTLTKKTPIAPSVDLLAIANDERGADLAALVREAAVLALRSTFYTDVIAEKMTNHDFQNDPLFIDQHHFEKAFLTVRPSVSEKDRNKYYNLNLRYSRLPVELT